MDTDNHYDLIIAGAGPAGLTASIYASRYKLKHIVIGEPMDGLMTEAYEICNYPSEIKISGLDLIAKMQKHSEHLGAKIIRDKIVNIVKNGKEIMVTTQKGDNFVSDTILLAIGTKHRKLNLKNEEKLTGRGVSYCATCDAMFYKNKIVAVVGGSDSAIISSLYLARVAKKVYQIYRRDKLRGEPILVEQAQNENKIEFIFNTNVVKLLGKEKLEGVEMDNLYKKSNKLAIDGLFIEIGTDPDINLLNKLNVKIDSNKRIVVEKDQSTNIKGVWAAGDITNSSNNLKQIITACSEGAIAAESIFKFIHLKKFDKQH